VNRCCISYFEKTKVEVSERGRKRNGPSMDSEIKSLVDSAGNNRLYDGGKEKAGWLEDLNNTSKALNLPSKSESLSRNRVSRFERPKDRTSTCIFIPVHDKWPRASPILTRFRQTLFTNPFDRMTSSYLQQNFSEAWLNPSRAAFELEESSEPTFFDDVPVATLAARISTVPSIGQY
jgi:hypothetical protein